MKKLFLFIIFIFLSDHFFAQTPSQLEFQHVANMSPDLRQQYFENGQWEHYTGNAWILQDDGTRRLSVSTLPGSPNPEHFYAFFRKYYKDADNDGYGGKTDYLYFYDKQYHNFGNYNSLELEPNNTYTETVINYPNNVNSEKYLKTRSYNFSGINWVRNEVSKYINFENFSGRYSPALVQDCDDSNSSLPTGIQMQYIDFDQDGYGTPVPYMIRVKLLGCINQENPYSTTSTNNLDCNDYEANVTTSPINWYYDSDGDGYGNPSIVINSCNKPDDYVINSDDCNDDNPLVNITPITWYADSDNDGFGDKSVTIESCYKPEGYITNCYFDNCPTEAGTRTNGCPQVAFDFNNENENYIYERVYTRGFQPSELIVITDNDVLERITYSDGLGRVIQQNNIGITPTGKNVITHIEYNGNGQTEKKYLPYSSTDDSGNFDSNSLTNTLDFYNTAEYDFTANPYAEVTFDNSPLGRVKEQGAAGESWEIDINSDNDHTIKQYYSFNTFSETDISKDNVKRFIVENPNDDIEQNNLILNGFYPANSLRKTIVKDENWKPNQNFVKDHTKESFEDHLGRIILVRTYNKGEKLDTYSCYDDFGNPIYILSPEASAKETIDAAVLDQLGYQYKYDFLNRIIEKKTPGKGWEYIIYDTLDRPILSQDANLKENNQWLFVKYDILGRVAYTGVYTSNSSRTSLQNTIDNHYIANPEKLYEERTQSLTSIPLDPTTELYYTKDSSFPLAIQEVYTINYYDDYLWDTQNSIEANYNVTTDGVTFNPSENTIEKTIGTSWTNAGFISDGVIEGDGYIQYTVTQTDKRVMVGLSKVNSAAGSHYNTIDYAIYTGYGDQSRVYIYIDGSFNSPPLTTFAVGDVFRVERSGNQILYKKNGTEFHATAIGNLGTLVGDASFCDFETKLSNVHIGYSVMGQDFTANVKGLPTGGKVRVLGTDKWITSVSYYDEKGRPIHSASENEYLGTNDAASSFLDFSGKVLKSNTTHRRGKENAVAIQDLFTYDKSNRLLYQTKQINSGAKELISKNHYNELGQLIQKQVGGRLPSLSTYTNVVNITESGNTVEKTSDHNWDGGLNTTETITGDGYFSFTPLQTTKTIIAGLSDTAGNESYQSIKYAIYATPTGEVRLLDAGDYQTNVSSYVAGDVLTVERRGSQIHYLKNGETFYISTSIDAGQPLLGDIAMYYPNTKLKDVVLVDLEKELQEVDYTYNVRGWLKGINDVNNQGDDLFSFALTYNDITGPTKRLFNGNISSTLWKTKGQDNSLKSYVYDYDALNRITSAEDNIGNYKLNLVDYDLNGNIKKLIRTGHKDANATAFGIMDDLNYNYVGNQLMNVSDNSSVDYGFKDGHINTNYDPTNVNNDYSYDANGNMVEDKNKDITNISYNYLNLPTQITFVNESSISYIYDASGVKQEKIVSNASLSSSQSTYYAGNYIYKKGSAQSPIVLTFFNSEEGYIEPVKESGRIIDFDYVYQYKDHLGNIRLAYQDMDGNGAINPITEIKEENHYYPFGLKHKGYNSAITGRDHNYGFNGIEESNELGNNILEMAIRQYDPAIARWTVIDPVTHFSLTPYNAFDNNPVYWADPSGADSEGNGDGDDDWVVIDENNVDHGDLETVIIYGNSRSTSELIANWSSEADEDSYNGSYEAWTKEVKYEGDFGGAREWWQKRYGESHRRYQEQERKKYIAEQKAFADLVVAKFNKGWSDWAPDSVGNQLMNISAAGIGVAMVAPFASAIEGSIALGQLSNFGYRVLGHMYIRAGTYRAAGGTVAGTTMTGKTAVEAYKQIAAISNTTTTAVANYYPPNNGAMGGITIKSLEIGKYIDRFGRSTGHYFSPYGTPLLQRSMSPSAKVDLYNAYKVIKSFDVEASYIMPWFNKVGTGIQYYSPNYSAQQLLSKGYIEPISLPQPKF